MTENQNIATHFSAYDSWRADLAISLAGIRAWLSEHELSDALGDMRLAALLDRLSEDKLYVAFVAEFSRGKSELINAIFFADYGSRILPSTAGRTTMCPTELLYDSKRAPYIDLLPIQTRSSNASINEYKKFQDEWFSVDLDVTSSEAMQNALSQVSQVIRITPDEATKLGFHVKSDDQENGFCQVGKDGLVEVPRWRHAVINFPHSLLKQGLVILDTPGLNAIGSEPELTLSLLPNAHAVLFILSADTGVTQTDMALWKDHILASTSTTRGRLVAMNKIDGQWDALKNEEAIEEEINHQRNSCADILELPVETIYPVSAQKGLLAKVNGDYDLLARSCLPTLEQALSDKLIRSKQLIVSESVGNESHVVYSQAKGVLDSRLLAIGEQLDEIVDLRGKNKNVIEYMMGKVSNEKEEFEAGLLRYYAVRSVFSTLSNNLLGHVSQDKHKRLNQQIGAVVSEAFFSRTLASEVNKYFDEIDVNLDLAASEVREIVNMLDATYKKMNVEHGLALKMTDNNFSLLRYKKEMGRLEEWSQLNMPTTVSMLTKGKAKTVEKFFDMLSGQVSLVFQKINKDVDIWVKSVMAPLETQIREHQSHLKRRLESIKRIHQATDTLETRISELEHINATMQQQSQELEVLYNDARVLLELTDIKSFSGEDRQNNDGARQVA